MRWIRLAVATLNQTPLDWAGNLDRCRAAVEVARDAGAGILCLPELALTGYGCEDAFHGLSHTERAVEQLLAFAPETSGMVVAVGLPIRLQHGLYNSMCFLADGRPVGVVAKQNLAGDGIHYEPRWFRPWTPGRMVSLNLGRHEVPFGDIVLDFGGVRVGAEICEDAWVPGRPGLRLAQAGCDIILNPSASHFSFGKWEVRERIVMESSRALGAAYAYANLLGNESGRVIYDGGSVIAASGEVIGRGPRFSYREYCVTSAVVDVDLLRMRRARTPGITSRDEGVHIVRVPHQWMMTDTPPSDPLGSPEDWNGGDHVKEEEFARAVSLGLFDYMRKSRSRGFVVSLSGGADSASVATLAALAFRFAAAELGPDELQRRLSYLTIDADSFSSGLLDTVFQGSKNSSDTTRNAAQTVADALGARHHVWQIDDLVTIYRDSIEGALGRNLTWEDDDIALQNIQARVRAPGVWMLANVRGALLLATSNRSEAAVGYATMDGDTAGSLSPIAGIDKNYLRRWLRWLAETGIEGIGPIPELMVICEIPPTAELRPKERRQTDEADLMPYDLLDAIERLAIRDRLEPLEVFSFLKDEWAPRVGGDEQLAFYIRRFFTLWCRNQWKRERYAPSFHLDDENLDPKTWCRFPILSGGYAEEFRALEAALAKTQQLPTQPRRPADQTAS